MSQPASPGADDDIGLARHAGVNGPMTQSQAEVRISRVGGQAADHVAWVDILQAYRNSLSRKRFPDPVSQERSNIAMEAIS
jgi:hypothetical protein